MSIPIGQTVAVKGNYKDEYSGVSLHGWSGRVVEMNPVEQLLTIEWDSHTLMRMPDVYCSSPHYPSFIRTGSHLMIFFLK